MSDKRLHVVPTPYTDPELLDKDSLIARIIRLEESNAYWRKAVQDQADRIDELEEELHQAKQHLYPKE